MAKKRHIVSIDIGTHSVKAAYLEQKHDNGEITISHSAVVEYEERELLGRGMQVTADSMQVAINSLEIPKKSPVVLSISRALLTTRWIDGLPIDGLNDANKLDNIVAFQAESILPFTTEEVVFDYYNPTEKGNALSVELVAARRADIENLLSPLKAINVTPQSVMPAMVATSRLSEQSSSGTMILDIGAGQSDLSIIKDGKVIFSRSFPLGGDQLTLSLSSEVSPVTEVIEDNAIPIPNFDTYENQKRNLLCPTDHDELSEATIGKWCQRLATEIQRSIIAYQQDTSSTPVSIDKILLTGGGSRLSGLASYLTRVLSISTHIWDMPSRLDVLQVKYNSDFLQISDQLAVVIGQGLAFLNDSVELDLLPKPEKQQIQKVDQQRRMLSRIAVGVGIAALLAIGVLSYGQYQQSEVDGLDQELQKLKSKANRARNTLKQELVVTQLMKPRLSALDLLREFSLRLSDRTKVALTTFQLTNLNDLTKARLNFNVEANSHQDISNLVTALNQSGIFKNLKQGQIISVNKDRKNIFQVQITCSIKVGAVKTLSEHRYLGTGLQISKTNRPSTEEKNRDEAERENKGEEAKSESNSKKSSKDKSFDMEQEDNKVRKEQSTEGKKGNNERSIGEKREETRWPSVEEYDRMSEEEQAEVKAKKKRLYDKDDPESDALKTNIDRQEYNERIK